MSQPGHQNVSQVVEAFNREEHSKREEQKKEYFKQLREAGHLHQLTLALAIQNAINHANERLQVHTAELSTPFVIGENQNANFDRIEKEKQLREKIEDTRKFIATLQNVQNALQVFPDQFNQQLKNMTATQAQQFTTLIKKQEAELNEALEDHNEELVDYLISEIEFKSDVEQATVLSKLQQLRDAFQPSAPIAGNDVFAEPVAVQATLVEVEGQPAPLTPLDNFPTIKDSADPKLKATWAQAEEHARTIRASERHEPLVNASATAAAVPYDSKIPNAPALDDEPGSANTNDVVVSQQTVSPVKAPSVDDAEPGSVSVAAPVSVAPRSADNALRSFWRELDATASDAVVEARASRTLTSFTSYYAIFTSLTTKHASVRATVREEHYEAQQALHAAGAQYLEQLRASVEQAKVSYAHKWGAKGLTELLGRFTGNDIFQAATQPQASFPGSRIRPVVAPEHRGSSVRKQFDQQGQPIIEPIHTGKAFRH